MVTRRTRRCGLVARRPSRSRIVRCPADRLTSGGRGPAIALSLLPASETAMLSPGPPDPQPQDHFRQAVLVPLPLHGPLAEDLETALGTVAQAGVEALVVLPNTFALLHVRRIVEWIA